MAARFLLDQHISRRVAEEAGKRGLDVRAVDGSDLEGADDGAVLRAAIREKRILVTYNNRDMVPLLVDLQKEGADVVGIVFVSVATIPTSDIGGLVRALVKLADLIEKKEVEPSGGIFLSREAGS